MKLIFKGIVQGVGFRPTIYRIAKDLGLKGYVLNKGSEVEVIIDKDIDEFIHLVKKNLPSIAKITDISIEEDSRKFKDFLILHSEDGERHSLIPADIGICNKCISELFDPRNRRYKFPFTNCTICGARYSLINDVPYDRERTSMDRFHLCNSCTEEYKNPLNRRYHAQTISCKNCGPTYKLYNNKNKEIINNNIIKFFAKSIDEGKIGIIKSWGGMHISCNIEEIKKFRKWYGRPQKSFAVMVKDIKTAEQYGHFTNIEREMLLSNKRPIVLVEKKKAEDVSPGLNTIGLYLPYTGLHYLLFSYLDSTALIMTSANIPGDPMMICNNETFSLNADLYLLHNRKIPNRIDDSVLRIWNRQTFFLRKSRGFVPDPLEVGYDKNVLSVGAGENICGGLSCDRKLYSTQYIGNSRYYSTLEFLEKSLKHMIKLTMEEEKIDAVGMDLHPGYDSRKIAEKLANEYNVPLFEIQHHWAHAVSLLLDNNIEESVVLTLDGLGYGSDGRYWGGEVLATNFESFKRIGHLEYIPLLGGDKATHDPRRLVYAIFKTFNQEEYFSGSEAEILDKMMSKAPRSSSLGRILDALSCYLGICKKRTYDGEPAMKLEKYIAKGEAKFDFYTPIKNGVINTTDLFRQLKEKIKNPITERQKADFAYSLVNSIIENLTNIAIEFASKSNIDNIGLTGGVSYNIPITEMVERQVKKNPRFALAENGGGNIGFGEAALCVHILEKV